MAIAAAESPKIASSVTAATVGVGWGTTSNYIPSDIGEVGVVVGIITSAIIVYFQAKKAWSSDKLNKLEYKKKEIECYLLRQEKEKSDREKLKDDIG